MPVLPNLDSTVRSLIQAQRDFEVEAYLRDQFPALELGERTEFAIVWGATPMAGLDDATPRVEATLRQEWNAEHKPWFWYPIDFRSRIQIFNKPELPSVVPIRKSID
jgi:hypothetical protein